MEDAIKRLVEDGLAINPIAMLIQLLATAILVFVLYKFLYKPVSEMLEKRRKLINKEIDEAKEANKNAKELNEKAEYNISLARKQADEIITVANRTAEAQSVEITQKAKLEANYKLEKAESDIAKKLEEAKAEIKDEISKNSVLVAEKMLKEKIDIDKQQELIDKAIDEVN